MKKFIFCLLLFSFITLTLFNVKASDYNFPLFGKLIVVDPGHGGLDSGAIQGKKLEKNINLEISLKLKKELEKNGATVLLTRDGDYDLSKPNALYRKKSDFDNRIKLINNSNADLYLSIHLNYFLSPKYYGPQVFYVKNNKALADSIQEEFNSSLKIKRDIKTINNVYMYNKLEVPGVLIECGFLSNYKEKRKLLTKSYQSKLVKIITNGIINYYQS
jgi:N-acetylmuramoyl-L-alanine amidase